MIRSTPSSSGSGNMTPASIRMAVSPQATTIMFMPNSPSPPSGISSSGGVPSTRVAVRHRQSETPVSKPGVEGQARSDAVHDGSGGSHAGGWRRLCKPTGTAAGTARPGRLESARL